MTDWLEVTRGREPLLVSIPHTGADLPGELLPRLVSSWLARKDTDWHVERLYDFAASLGATVLRTRVCRTTIDANRDPSGASLYPGRPTTELCPTTTFDGEPLYRPGCEPTPAEIAERQTMWFVPYHVALAAEIKRLRAAHGRVVVYDCHSIRSVVPRLFDGELPHFNIGTDGGRSCDPGLTAAVEAVVRAADVRSEATSPPVPLSEAERGCPRCVESRVTSPTLAHPLSASERGTGGEVEPPPTLTRVTNGRFRGGYITRHHGRPADDVHAIQMELAIRGYLREPVGPADERNWPPEYDPTFATPMRDTLRRVLDACLAFARGVLP